MATPSLLNESAPRAYQLQSEYEVVLTSNVVTVKANVHTLEDGDLQFWNVNEDGAWSFAVAFAYGSWESFRSIQREDVDPWVPSAEEIEEIREDLKTAVVETPAPKLDRDEYEEALLKEGLSPEVASQLASLITKSRPVDRDAVSAGLKRGEYPDEEFDTVTGIIRPPQKLKDVWEGQGEAFDEPDVDDGPGWAKREQARHEAEMEKLRAEARLREQTRPIGADFNVLGQQIPRS